VGTGSVINFVSASIRCLQRMMSLQVPQQSIST
jgi:hypothetical protein